MEYALVAVLVLAICLNTAQGVAAIRGITIQVLPRTVVTEFLEAHNRARAAVGVESLMWSGRLATAANRTVRYQRDNMGCQFANLTDNKYGANQHWGGGAAWRPRKVVASWVEEKNYYDYACNSCAPNSSCRSYTQVVWKNTLELGCAQAKCSDQITLTICFYNPPGNLEGQRPY